MPHMIQASPPRRRNAGLRRPLAHLAHGLRRVRAPASLGRRGRLGATLGRDAPALAPAVVGHGRTVVQARWPNPNRPRPATAPSAPARSMGKFSWGVVSDPGPFRDHNEDFVAAPCAHHDPTTRGTAGRCCVAGRRHGRPRRRRGGQPRWRSRPWSTPTPRARPARPSSCSRARRGPPTSRCIDASHGAGSPRHGHHAARRWPWAAPRRSSPTSATAGPTWSAARPAPSSPPTTRGSARCCA